jgi:hypothetical protein
MKRVRVIGPVATSLWDEPVSAEKPPLPLAVPVILPATAALKLCEAMIVIDDRDRCVAQQDGFRGAFGEEGVLMPAVGQGVHASSGRCMSKQGTRRGTGGKLRRMSEDVHCRKGIS